MSTPKNKDNEVRWADTIGYNMIGSSSLQIGNPGDACYQKITHQPCEVCGQEMVNVLDIAEGYPTMINIPKCSKCKYKEMDLTPPIFISTPVDPDLLNLYEVLGGL